MILRVKFTKKNYLKYIGHLDLLRLFQRTFRRADLPVKYSKGFNPHPRFSIANPLSLGIESEGEYMDIELVDNIDTEDFVSRMNNILPKDVQILKSVYTEDKKSISSKLSWALYEIRFDINEDLSLDQVKEKINTWLTSDEIIISRLRKKGRRKVMREEDIRPLIGKIEVKDKIDDEVILEVLMKVGDGGNLRPFDFVEALTNSHKLSIDVDSPSLIRKALYIEDGDKLHEPI